jgi:hypothetical protein
MEVREKCSCIEGSQPMPSWPSGGKVKRWEVKKVNAQEMDFLMSRGNKFAVAVFAFNLSFDTVAYGTAARHRPRNK